MIQEEAKWVRPDEDCEAPIILGKIFAEEGMESAKISICGLGFFELYINGRKVSEDLMVPAWSDYEPRSDMGLLYPLNDRFTHRAYYLEYDIADFLQEGENGLEVWLGNGWYNQHERNIEGNLWYGKPKLAYTVEIAYREGKLSMQHSGERLTWKRSPITFNNVYYGEKWNYDAMEPQERPVAPAEPVLTLSRQECPADREIRSFSPRLIRRSGDRSIYDAGENLTGYAACAGRGRIIIRYAEELGADGELDFTSAGGKQQIQCDEYLTGSERRLKPRFSVKGFRFAKITGEVKEVEVIAVHSDVAVTSSFVSGDETLNWLYEAYIRSQLNNMHYGIVSDCPHRERLGYTGDGQLTCNAAMLLLDSRRLYRKWIRDILDSQDPNTGHVQHTAPFYGGGGGPGGWGGAVVIVPYTFYRHFKDRELLAECWPH